MKSGVMFKMLSVIFAVLSTAALAKEPEPIHIRMAWHISVDAQGQITSIWTGETKLAEVQDRIEREIRSWYFQPGKVNGVPAASESTLRLTLEATPNDGDGYTLKVVKANTGAYYAKIVMPRYPDAFVKSRRQGYVVLKVRYGADGKVLDAALADDAPEVAPAFVQASINAVRNWEFAPEVIGGHPRAGAALVPLCFNPMRGTRYPRDCTWSRRSDGLKVSGDEAVALDPAVSLKSDVAGHAL
ncbi:energy transducer TonB [Dokdonella sp.]|uniref:energy transducer TonB n=1 Tax=Dokdonella sp. TaxID=2291710 RepID=UPI0025B7FF03|nr:energy transducer TonB [Dokdonella sp.]MBX3689602.1 energy transducer TonB [Dokdonella sp.]